MSENLTTAQAVTRARWMIESATKLIRAAEAVTDARGTEVRDAAEVVKDAQLLDYRVSTIPDALVPVLEALVEAVSKPGGTR